MLKLKNKNNSRSYYNNQLGFTFIELLIVISIISVLMGIIVIIANPGEELADARNNQRKAHVNTIYGAIEQYVFQYGDFPVCIETSEQDAILCEAELVPDYLSAIPKDPTCGNGDSEYKVKRDAVTGETGVKAVCAELGEEIVVGKW